MAFDNCMFMVSLTDVIREMKDKTRDYKSEVKSKENR